MTIQEAREIVEAHIGKRRFSIDMETHFNRRVAPFDEVEWAVYIPHEGRFFYGPTIQLAVAAFVASRQVGSVEEADAAAAAA